METELWPNLVREAKAAGVPLVTGANARLSEGFCPRLPAHFSWASEPMFASWTGSAVQTSAERLAALNGLV